MQRHVGQRLESSKERHLKHIIMSTYSVKAQMGAMVLVILVIMKSWRK